MTSRPAIASLQALADTLWAQRRVVEVLLAKLTTAKLLLAAGERRFVPLALDEVERVVAALCEAELRRSMAVAAVAAEWRRGADELTLRVLAREAPEPWREVFGDHAAAFAGLAGEIDEAMAENRTLAAGGLDRIDEAMDLLAGGARSGWVGSAVPRSQRTLHAVRTDMAEVEDVDIAAAVLDLQVQEVAYQATLEALAGALPPSLIACLR